MTKIYSSVPMDEADQNGDPFEVVDQSTHRVIFTRNDQETLLNSVRGMYYAIREGAKSLYFFCFLESAYLSDFMSFLRNHRVKQVKRKLSFDKWEYGHRLVLRRTYDVVEDYVSPEDYAWFAYNASSPCSCYDIEKGYEMA
jgi:hypothetical protein